MPEREPSRPHSLPPSLHLLQYIFISRFSRRQSVGSISESWPTMKFEIRHWGDPHGGDDAGMWVQFAAESAIHAYLERMPSRFEASFRLLFRFRSSVRPSSHRYSQNCNSFVCVGGGGPLADLLNWDNAVLIRPFKCTLHAYVLATWPVVNSLSRLTSFFTQGGGFRPMSDCFVF